MVFLRRPTVYLDPGVRDDRRALARRGIVLVGSAKSAWLIDVERPGSPLSERAAAMRAWVRGTLADVVGRWSARSAAIATAVLIGDRTGLPDADTRRLQDAGTYHVIAISGGNIAILTVMLLAVCAVAGLPVRPSAVLTILALLAYREIVVATPSVERAITAALLYLVARVIDHRGAALNVLAVAAAIGLALSPVVLLDAGFLLSFGATLGILLAMAGRSPPARGGSPLRRAATEIGAMLATTAAAEAALLPVSAVLFGRVTLAGLALNLVAIPLMSVLQAASMVALALSSISLTAAHATGFVAHLAAAGILESARLTTLVPLLARDVASPSTWIVVAYYACGVALVMARPPLWRRTAGAALAIAMAIILVGAGWAADVLAAPSTGIRVVVLDVGQGDATVIILPGGRAVLVDAGGVAAAMPRDDAEEEAGGFDIGQRVVVPALRALGVTRLEALTITHGDPDHIGGAQGVLRSFRPGSIWDGVPVPPHAALRALSDRADALGIPWRTV
ncbi:MAG: ComEC/Rec2 family competence protein, partial [Vicinamibacterales bacterium]